MYGESQTQPHQKFEPLLTRSQGYSG